MHKIHFPSRQTMKLWFTWNFWTGLSLLVAFIGSFFSWALISPMLGYSSALEILPILLPGVVLSGGIAGLIQRIALKDRIQNSYWWVLATTLGLPVALASLIFYPRPDYQPDGTIAIGMTIPIAFLSGAVGGAVIGLLQWLVLRRQVPGAGWWLLGSALGWACSATALSILMLWSMDLETAGGFAAAAGFVVGTVVQILILTLIGMITGVVYVYLFKESGQDQPELNPS